MAAEAEQPLLGEQEAPQAWDDVESLSGASTMTDRCTVQALLEEHEGKGDVLRHLQLKGVVKLGDVEEQDRVVSPAFGAEPLLTFGSPARELDYEQEWTRVLRRQYDRSQRSWLRRVARPVGKAGWSNSVGLEAFAVTLRGAAWPGDDGIIRPLLKRWQARSCSFAVFSLPAVQAVIRYKWSTYGRRLMQAQLACFLLWLLAYNAFIVAFEDEDLDIASLRQLLGTARGRVAVTAELLALLFMAPFLALEVGTVSTYGWYFFDAWNRLDLATYLLQVGITILHLSRTWLRSSLLSNMLALQCILLLFRLQYYSQVFRPSRFSFLDMGTVIINLLLGLVINSLDKVMEQEVMRMLLNQARVIDELESSMPKWIMRWGVKHGWFPEFVHALRMNEDSLDAVDMDRLQTFAGKGRHVRLLSKRNNNNNGGGGGGGGGDEGGKGGEEGSSSGGGQGQGQGQGHELEAQMREVQVALRRQEAMLRVLCDRQ